MFNDEVVVLHVLDISCYAVVDVVWFFVVFQVLVVHQYCGYVG